MNRKTEEIATEKPKVKCSFWTLHSIMGVFAFGLLVIFALSIPKHFLILWTVLNLLIIIINISGIMKNYDCRVKTALVAALLVIAAACLRGFLIVLKEERKEEIKKVKSALTKKIVLNGLLIVIIIFSILFSYYKSIKELTNTEAGVKRKKQYQILMYILTALLVIVLFVIGLKHLYDKRRITP